MHLASYEKDWAGLQKESATQKDKLHALEEEKVARETKAQELSNKNMVLEEAEELNMEAKAVKK